MTCVTFRYFLYTTSIKFFVQGNQHTTELAEPLFYHGDAKANRFIEANSFIFLFLANHLLLMRNHSVLVYVHNRSNRYFVISFIIRIKEYNLGLQPT